MNDTAILGNRRFGKVNWLGLYTLASREMRRFLSIWTQTILAPLVTSALFLAIFSLAIGPTRGDVMGVSFVKFLAPGILMMTVVQNAFTNSSGSIMSAKVQGNIVDTLMPPLSAMELLMGYLAGSVGRGVLIAVAVWTVMALFIGVGLAHPLWAMTFVLLGTIFMGCLGIVAAVYATRFDQMAAITNFIITPLSFLSGSFYSIEALPPAVQTLTRMNPVFYLIDGVRFGIIGRSDSNPWIGVAVLILVTSLLLALCWSWFKRGYRLKS